MGNGDVSWQEVIPVSFDCACVSYSLNFLNVTVICVSCVCDYSYQSWL